MAARMNDLSLPSHGPRVDLAGRYEAWYMAQTQQVSDCEAFRASSRSS